MKENGIHWTAHAQLIRRGGLVGAKTIKTEEADGFSQALRASDVAATEAKINESRAQTTEFTHSPVACFIPGR